MELSRWFSIKALVNKRTDVQICRPHIHTKEVWCPPCNSSLRMQRQRIPRADGSERLAILLSSGFYWDPLPQWINWRMITDDSQHRGNIWWTYDRHHDVIPLEAFLWGKNVEMCAKFPLRLCFFLPWKAHLALHSLMRGQADGSCVPRNSPNGLIHALAWSWPVSVDLLTSEATC